ncbi:Gfo/Idh/MocA family protein [Galbibacter sp.]|jgi:predicted dehydrogenase|uniref:Gfo/Idh/MocA family protein n=1 Tax=Galbibacter sp. TaxID=2918471 RepID=UPI003A8E8824
MMKNDRIRILIVGCGNMGASHAMAYDQLKNDFEICGLVARGDSKHELNKQLKANYPVFDSYKVALKESKPDAVCISTYPDTHQEYALAAFDAGCEVFLEKPIATTVQGAKALVEAANKSGKKLVIGYILRQHPCWQKFIDVAQGLGKPLVMRMNLNQQSHGYMWDVHKNLMKSLSPIVDCGVHYIDVMCQMVRSKPKQVSAIGARLTDEISPDNYNYGQLQITFEDGSIGWYEAGWGPMISETAHFIKDVIGPKGSVSIVSASATEQGATDSVDRHTKTESLKIHHAEVDASNEFTQEDQWIHFKDEPDHLELCMREQLYFLDAIRNDVDLSDHLQDAVSSLEVVLACDESVKSGKTVYL